MARCPTWAGAIRGMAVPATVADTSAESRCPWPRPYRRLVCRSGRPCLDRRRLASSGGAALDLGQTGGRGRGRDCTTSAAAARSKRARPCRRSRGGNVAKLLEPDARALAPAAPTPQRDRAPDDLAGGHAGGVARSADRTGRRAAGPVATDRPRPVRDRRQPLPAIPQGRRPRARRRRRPGTVRVRARRTARASRCAPPGPAFRAGAGRRHPGRRAPALVAESRSRTAAGVFACARGRSCRAPISRWRRTVTGWGPTRPAPRHAPSAA